MRVAPQLFLLITALSLTPICHADTSVVQDQASELEQLRQTVEKQGKQLQEQQKQIENLLMGPGVNSKTLNIRGLGEPGPDQPPAEESTNKEKKPAGKQAPETQGELPTQPVGRAPEKPPLSKQYKEIEAIFQHQGVLTPKHTLVLEPSFEYSYSSSNSVLLSGYTIVPALTVGLINTERLERNTYIPALSARYGLTDRLEMQVYVPWIHREDSTVLTAQNLGTANETQPIFNTKGSNIGDIQFGFRYQLNSGIGGGPIFIAGLLAKADTGTNPFSVPTDPTTGTQLKLPTGTGFWGIQPGLSVIFPSDPVVFFGSGSYLYSFRADYPINGVETEIVPGGTLAFNFGMGFSLNERTSLSMGYEQWIVFPTDVVSSSIVLSPIETQSTTLGCLVFGAAYRWSDAFTINFSLEAGITKDAPDVQMTVRFPFSI